MATLSRKSSEFARRLDRKCIKHEGYLIKSPPECDSKIIKKRWRLRWFVLYDTQAIVDTDPSVEREVELIYYKNEEKVIQGHPPKGKISLIDTVVYKHNGELHGYPHTINIQTYNRLYHLCTTQPSVHTEWLEKICEHYVPKGEIPGRCLGERLSSNTSCQSSDEEETLRLAEYPGIIRTHQTATLTSNRYSSISADAGVDCSIRHDSITSRNSNQSVDFDYTYNPHSSVPLKAVTLGRWICTEKTNYKKPCPLPPGDHRRNEMSYVVMTGYYKDKIGTVVESEDEGIGRTDSESSSVSSSISSIASSYTSTHHDAWRAKRNSALSGLISTRLQSTSSCKDSLLLGGFVGPRLSVTQTRAKSLGDVSLPGETTMVFEEEC